MHGIAELPQGEEYLTVMPSPCKVHFLRSSPSVRPRLYTIRSRKCQLRKIPPFGSDLEVVCFGFIYSYIAGLGDDALQPSADPSSLVHPVNRLLLQHQPYST